MGKQVLEKCLTSKPQSEFKMRTLLPLILAEFYGDNCFSEKVTGKLNRSKTSSQSNYLNE